MFVLLFECDIVLLSIEHLFQELFFALLALYISVHKLSA
jgi:hypothetical protein